MSHGLHGRASADTDGDSVGEDIESELQTSDREACSGLGVVGSALYAMPDRMARVAERQATTGPVAKRR